MSSYREAAQDLKQRITAVQQMHKKVMNGDGSTSGYCAECDWLWPCPTYHATQGWDHHECEAEKWCSHESVPYR